MFTKGIDHGSYGVVSASLERTEDTHEDCLAVRTACTAIPVAVFANNDSRPNLPLAMVIVKGNQRVVKECEQVVLVTTQAFYQSFSMVVAPVGIDQVLQPNRQSLTARSIRFGRHFLSLSPQSNRIAEQSAELFGKGICMWKLKTSTICESVLPKA